MERIWAPWRLEYILNNDAEPGCFLCNAWEDVGGEAERLVLARGRLAFVIMNRFPYSNAHLMVTPVRHVGGFEEATPEEAAELWSLTALAKRILAEVVRMDGCNIGVNQGKVAGAGLLDHLHLHVVPRWNGDTNFMPVMSDVRVMPQALDACYRELRPAFVAAGYA